MERGRPGAQSGWAAGDSREDGFRSQEQARALGAQNVALRPNTTTLKLGPLGLVTLPLCV